MSDISDKLEKQADLLFRNISGWQNNALKRIGRRVKSIGTLSYADLQAINNASIVNQDVTAILDELADVTKQNASEVQKIYAQMIEAQHLENRPLYDYRGKPFIPFADNKQLQAIVRAYARTTNETMVNLSMTRARQLGFVDSGGNFVPIEKNFKDVMDKAVMSVATGTGDFNSEMRDVLKELGGSGLRGDYGGGFTRRLDSMVRQNLLWGAKQASVEYSEMIGEELECDGIEIDWHSNPRPSHEFMQGKQYSLHGKKTIGGVTYESADRALDALNDYGCLHFKTPIICGVSVPRFDDDELARLNAENAREIEIDGIKKTGYGWKQTMRRLETEARKTHEQITLLKASGDKEGVRQLRDKLCAIEDKYYNIADGAGMKAQPQRMAVVKVKKYKNLLQNDGDSGIINFERSISSRSMANGLRKPATHILSEIEIEIVKEDIIAIGADEKVFRFNSGFQTSYSDKFDVIFVRGDVLPDETSQHPRDLMSTRAVIAHEYYGHRVYRGTKLKKGSWNDEFRASYMAAKNTPNLSHEDRRYLILDALERAKESGVTIKNNDFIRRTLYGY